MVNNFVAILIDSAGKINDAITDVENCFYSASRYYNLPV